MLCFFEPLFSDTLISPTPPAGMSFCERRTPVQPHPAFNFLINKVEVPVFLNLKIYFNSIF